MDDTPIKIKDSFAKEITEFVEKSDAIFLADSTSGTLTEKILSTLKDAGRSNPVPAVLEIRKLLKVALSSAISTGFLMGKHNLLKEEDFAITLDSGRILN